MGIKRQAVVLHRAKNQRSVRIRLANVVSAFLGKWPTSQGGCPMFRLSTTWLLAVSAELDVYATQPIIRLCFIRPGLKNP